MVDEGEKPAEADEPPPPSPQSATHSRFGGAVLFPQRYTWLILVSALDVFFTTIILTLGGSEVNAFADYLLQRWDMWGLIGLKFVAVSIAIALCEIIGRMRYATGERFAEWAIAISAMPVVIAIIQLVVFTWL